LENQFPIKLKSYAHRRVRWAFFLAWSDARR
jgi:hypothetical protein